MSLADIKLSQLESHLWEAANILRGPVDAADFKAYVFPLLFFKRLSGVRSIWGKLYGQEKNLTTSVIANSPSSLEKWGDEFWASDPCSRNFAGMPPAKRPATSLSCR